MISKIGMADESARQVCTSDQTESGLRNQTSLDFGTSFLSTLYATTIIVAFSVILCIASQSLVGGYVSVISIYAKKMRSDLGRIFVV